MYGHFSVTRRYREDSSPWPSGSGAEKPPRYPGTWFYLYISFRKTRDTSRSFCWLHGFSSTPPVAMPMRKPLPVWKGRLFSISCYQKTKWRYLHFIPIRNWTNGRNTFQIFRIPGWTHTTKNKLYQIVIYTIWKLSRHFIYWIKTRQSY